MLSNSSRSIGGDYRMGVKCYLIDQSSIENTSSMLDDFKKNQLSEIYLNLSIKSTTVLVHEVTIIDVIKERHRNRLPFIQL